MIFKRPSNAGKRHFKRPSDSVQPPFKHPSNTLHSRPPYTPMAFEARLSGAGNAKTVEIMSPTLADRVTIVDPSDIVVREVDLVAVYAEAARVIRLMADKQDDPRRAAAMALAAASLEPRRPGPSRERQTAKAIRDSRLRRIRRQHYASLSDAGAATAMWSDASSYENGQYRRHDEPENVAPSQEPRATFFAALTLGPFPKIKTLQNIFAQD